MERAWSYLDKLSRYPHRGVGTKEEAAAAAEAAQWLKDLGYHVDIQPFQAPRDTLYLGPVVLMLAFLVAGPMTDVKNTLMMSSAFKRKFVLFLNVTILTLTALATILLNYTLGWGG